MTFHRELECEVDGTGSQLYPVMKIKVIPVLNQVPCHKEVFST
jgi:hypothetical protein